MLITAGQPQDRRTRGDAHSALAEELQRQTKALDAMGDELLAIRECSFPIVSATLRRHANEIGALAARFLPYAAQRAA
jgi:hypothetical protein